MQLLSELGELQTVIVHPVSLFRLSSLAHDSLVEKEQYDEQ